MKKMRMFSGMLAMLLVAAPLFAQGRVVERTWLSTDKDVYVAGESVWYSAFCLDASQRTFSPVSSVAYVELHSVDALAATSKVALVDGRGGGRLQLPQSLPTGNYRLIVYTSQNKDEVDYDYEGLASKTISVFNVFTSERVKEGIEVVDAEEYARLRSERSPVRPGMTGNNVMPGSDRIVMPGSDRASLSLQWDGSVLTLSNPTDESVSLSLSVWHDDGFLANDNPGIDRFLTDCRAVGPRTFRGEIVPDYEGEIIRGRITGFNQAMIPELIGRHAFIASPSDKSDIYAAPIGDDGSLTFYTANIYGNKECVCEIEGLSPESNCHVELLSPFVNALLRPAAPLVLSDVLADALKTRRVHMQIERQFDADTLYEFLPVRGDGLFDEESCVRYVLDDYTRFHTLEEDFIEFIPELRARKGPDGKTRIQVRLNEDAAGYGFTEEPALVLLDGVPIFDHTKMMAYDPLLVESITVYPQTCQIGSRIFRGIVHFVTYKRNLPGFTFDGSTRVVDWQGVSWPQAYTGSSLGAGDLYPDYRQTIYWHPLLTLAPGQTLTIPLQIPDYKGSFVVKAEGLTPSATPVSGSLRFNVND
ncbi:MAG: hypothetical protein J5702_01470 [Bacteroidales bacterium]|nr:hypothetical protein [Bacteroidales bacterium]